MEVPRTLTGLETVLEGIGADLYVKFGDPPTLESYDYASLLRSSNTSSSAAQRLDVRFPSLGTEVSRRAAETPPFTIVPASYSKDPARLAAPSFTTEPVIADATSNLAARLSSGSLLQPRLGVRGFDGVFPEVSNPEVPATSEPQMVNVHVGLFVRREVPDSTLNDTNKIEPSLWMRPQGEVFWDYTAFAPCPSTCGAYLYSVHRVVKCVNRTSMEVIGDSFCLATGEAPPPQSLTCKSTQPCTESFTVVDARMKKGGWVVVAVNITDPAPMLRFSSFSQLLAPIGDADLYIRRGQPPTEKEYDHRPYRGGTDEQVNTLLFIFP